MQGIERIRRTVRVAGLLVMAAMAVVAQNAPQPDAAPNAGGREVKVFRTGSLPVEPIRGMMGTEFRTLSLGEDAFGIVGNPAELARAEKMFQTLLQSMQQSSGPKQVRLLISVIGAKKAGSAGAMPERLRAVSKELTSLFSYASYELLDEVPVVVSPLDGAVFASNRLFGSDSLLPGCSDVREATCQYKFQGTVAAINGSELKISQFQYTLSIPREMVTPSSSSAKDQSTPVRHYDRLTLNTSFQIATGQSLVLGKLNAASQQDAVFVVVTRLPD